MLHISIIMTDLYFELSPIIGFKIGRVISHISYYFFSSNNAVIQIQSNLPMWSPLLSSPKCDLLIQVWLYYEYVALTHSLKHLQMLNPHYFINIIDICFLFCILFVYIQYILMESILTLLNNKKIGLVLLHFKYRKYYNVF
jgi:hypothetical protein